MGPSRGLLLPRLRQFLQPFHHLTAFQTSSLRHVRRLTAATACLLKGAGREVARGSTLAEAAALHAGKKGAKRVNYCFITFDNWRSAQRACNQSERNIFGKVG